MEVIVPGLQVGIAFQSLLFVFYLLTGDRFHLLANRINLALLIVLTVHMTLNLLNPNFTSLMLHKIIFGFGLLYGPLIYFYINALIYSDYSWKIKNYLHFTPCLLVSAWSIFGSIPGEWGAFLTFISMGCYLFLSSLRYLRFRKIMKQTQSAEDLITMNWVVFVLVLNAIAIFSNIISFTSSLITPFANLAIWSEIGLFLVLLILVNAFIFAGLTQPTLFSGISKQDESIVIDVNKVPEFSNLNEEIKARIESKLLDYMQHKKPYLDPMFNLQSLGRQLGETPRYVSLIINHVHKKTFSDFVNYYRLVAVKECMSDVSDNRTIVDIINACGFSTKSNFNRAFKKQEGITPSEYRNRIKRADLRG
jgi:AraC-like DNA-binding protein